MVGSAMLEGGTPKTHNNTKGLVRGFDVRTGRRLWTFNTIPRPGEFGNDTWLERVVGGERQRRRLEPDRASTKISASRICRSRRRARISTAACGPATTCSPRASSRSTTRPASGSGTSSSCTIRSGTWTSRRRRCSSDLTVNGQPVKAVAVMGKQALLYLFNRVTGEPIFPIEERPVPQSDVPGRRRRRRSRSRPDRRPYDYQGVTTSRT